MKRALFVAPVAVLIALYAYAGPRPRATVQVPGTSTVVTHYFGDVNDGVLLQCPGGSVWYRVFTQDEYAAQDGGVQFDGGAFGVLVDFTLMGDPMPISRANGQVAIGLLGADGGLRSYALLEADGGVGPADGGTLADGGAITGLDAGILPCFFSTP